MTKLVNNGDAVDLYFPAGHPDTLEVGAGQVVDLGEVKVEEGDDCWLVGEGDNVRAWPKERWSKQGEKSNPTRPKKADDKVDDKPSDQPTD